ncbi:MAG TPA: glycosyltransferase family 4 protein [Candidatus Krumholzibacteriaceae bacterium]|nr:glycosyltransferase family 4 protein [Candidatus Krumholzibacteriaceae bacterium]
MKKVLFLSHYFPPEVNAPARRTYEHAIKWVANGSQVTIITNHPNHPHGHLYKGYKNRWISRERIDGINVIRVKTYLTANKGITRRAVNFVLYMVMAVFASIKVKKVDVVIATSPQFFCGLAGTIIKKIKRVRFILEIRDLWPDSIIAVGTLKEGFLVRVLRFMEKYMYFSADKIVTLTDTFKEHIEKTGYPARKITTIPNSFDLDNFESEEEIYSEFLKSSKFICSYIGTFGMAHNLEVVLKAAKYLRDTGDIHFLLIGDGAEKAEIVEKLEKMNLENVTILPLQPKERVMDFYRISDIGLIMLKDSVLFSSVIPSKMFEYMAVKSPVIMSVPRGEATAIVEKHDCGVLCDPDSPSKLADCIWDFYSNPEKLEKCGNNGLKAVMEIYNRETLASKYLDVIEAS